MPTDSLGNWELIGVVTPLEDWQLLDSSLIGKVVLRFTYTVDWFQWDDYYGCRSYALLRFYYPTPTTTVSNSYKVHPKKEIEIREFETPLDSLKDIGVKRVHYPKFRRYYSAIPLNWELKVEQLIS